MGPRQRDRYSRAVYSRAEELFNEEPQPTAAKIARTLEEEFVLGRQADKALAVPQERTVRNWIRDGVIQKDDEQRPWLWSDERFSPTEVRIIAEELEAVRVMVGSWEPVGTTVAKARLIARLRQSFPDDDGPLWAWQLACAIADGRISLAQSHEWLMYRSWTIEGEIALVAAILEGRLAWARDITAGVDDPETVEPRPLGVPFPLATPWRTKEVDGMGEEAYQAARDRAYRELPAELREALDPEAFGGDALLDSRPMEVFSEAQHER